MNTHLSKLLFFLLFSAIVNTAIAQSFDIPGPSGSGGFGRNVTVLTNGNYVVVDQNYDDGAIADVGAVYLYNGITHTLISTLKGSTAGNNVGLGGVYPLSNGNFIVSSLYWDNGAATNAGAATWVNGLTGLNAVVNNSNSLIGSQPNDNIGSSGIIILSNGNYVVSSIYCSNGAISNAGAATWGNGSTGVSGVVTTSNSLMGSTNVERLGTVTPLINGNYVVNSPNWNNGFGAAIWCNGTTGRVGSINNGNALVGNNATQFVGNAVTALSNGNYVVISYNWNSISTTKIGAVTWCNGATGTIGIVSAGNSLSGSSTDDQIGSYGVVALPNGNFLLLSPDWDNGAIINAGAVTLLSGTTATTGVVNSSNSLVGSAANDNVGISGATVLTNGNYVVTSPYWDNAAITDAGAVTWCNGSTGLVGPVSSSNSLVGGTANDNVGSDYAGITDLTNGNYVVRSSNWDNGAIINAGAATWCNGTTGRVGLVSTGNSLVGNNPNDNVSSSGIFPLSNDNYVVASEFWDNGGATNSGAVTWCNGTTGTIGVVSTGNSLTGSSIEDNVGINIYPLTNGNYIVSSYYWDNGVVIPNAGAVTWCNGTTGLAGAVSAANSLTGSTNADYVGYIQTTGLSNGNYVAVSFNWDNGPSNGTGAITLCNGATGLTGVITNCNSVLGSTVNGGGQIRYAFNYTNDYLIVGRPADNIVTIFDATGMALANDLDTRTVNIAGNNTVPLLSSNGCRIIATITASGASPVSGSVTAKAWVEPSVPTYGGDPFVARHYEITPASNASIATGRVTLYFTQQEFTDFNTHPLSALDLPTGPSDAIGISNLRIGKYGGTNNNGSGLPGTYTGTIQVINPADLDIVWKNNLSRWEVSFDVTGFSGFFVQTKITQLPLTLLEFNGHLNNNNGVLNWKTTGELNVVSFDIERSTDGRIFSLSGNVAAFNQPGINLYSYTDNNIISFGVPVVYYRLKQKDINGRFTYSGIVALSIDKYDNIVHMYPNPVITNANLTVNVNRPELLILKIFDNSGRLLQQQQLTISAGSTVFPVNVKNLVKGVYYLEIKGETVNEHISFVKQ